MDNINISDFLSDPLSEVSRRERRNLLLTSLTGILIAKVGLIPSRISALGIEFTLLEQQALMTSVSFVIGYFVLAFILYGLADFFVWRDKYQKYIEDSAIKSLNWSKVNQDNYDELHSIIPKAIWLYSKSKILAKVRVMFDFLFPIILGVTAIYLLITNS